MLLKVRRFITCKKGKFVLQQAKKAQRGGVEE
jgi:hypothetical protein